MAGPLGGKCNTVEHPGSWFWVADSSQPRRGAVRLKLAVMDIDARRELHRQPWIDGREADGAGGAVCKAHRSSQTSQCHAVARTQVTMCLLAAVRLQSRVVVNPSQSCVNSYSGVLKPSARLMYVPCHQRLGQFASRLVGCSNQVGSPVADGAEGGSKVVAAAAELPGGATVQDIALLVAAQTAEQSPTLSALSRTSAALFQPAAAQRPDSNRDSMPGTIAASTRSDSSTNGQTSATTTPRGKPDVDGDRVDDASTTHLTEGDQR